MILQHEKYYDAIVSTINSMAQFFKVIFPVSLIYSHY